MEPASIVTTIIGIYAFSLEIYDYLKDVKSASSDREKYLTEIFSLSTLLSHMKACLEKDNIGELILNGIRTLSCEGGVKKTVKTVFWNYIKDDVSKTLTKVERIKSSIILALQLGHWHLSEMTHQSIAKVKEDTQARQLDKLLDWISPTDYRTVLQDNFKLQHRKICNWFLSNDIFTNWATGSNSMLFCPGDPGAGKTVMSTVAIKHLFTYFDFPNIAICYIPLKYTMADDQTAPALLFNLLRQLVAVGSDAPPSQRLLEQHKRGRALLSEDDARQNIEELCVHFCRIYIVVDGLDESELHTVTALVEVIRELSRLYPEDGKPTVKLMATSRKLQIYCNIFQGEPTLEIKAPIDDIRIYLDSKFATLPNFVRNDNSLQNKTIEVITNAANGIFLLAQLHMATLSYKNQVTPKDFKCALEIIRSGPAFSPESKSTATYDTVYQNIVDRITSQSENVSQRAKRALTWIVFCKRQLNIEELRYAMAVELGATSLDLENLATFEQLEATLAGLIASTPHGGVELVHHTAYKYFKRNFRQWIAHPHLDIAHICVTYLSFKFEKSDWISSGFHFHRKYALFPYAASYWGSHDQEIACDDASEDIQKYKLVTLRFFSTPWSIALAFGRVVRSKDWHGMPTAAHLVAVNGTERHVRMLIENGSDVDCHLNERLRPLHLGVMYGNEGVCEAFVASGKVSLDAPSGRRQSTPLHLAARTRRLKLTVFLLETRRVDINAQDINGHSPLHASLGRTGSERQQIGNLFRKETRDSRLAIVRMLLSSEAIDKTQVDNQGRTALHLAAELGRADCIPTLLDHGFDVNTQDTKMLTPLDVAFASRWGFQSETIQVLQLQAGVRNYGGRSILLSAALSGNSSRVDMMLQDNCRVHWTKDSIDGIHLKEFIDDLGLQYNRIPEVVVRLVVKVTIEELQRDYAAGGTILPNLLKGRLFESLQESLFADQRLDPNLRDDEETRLLTSVATTGPLTLLQRMIALGGDLCAQNKDGFTPLSGAIIGRQVEMVRYLLNLSECGITLKTPQGDTPLDTACQSRDFAKLSGTESGQLSQSPEEEIVDLVRGHPYFRSCDETVNTFEQTSGLTLRDGCSNS